MTLPEDWTNAITIGNNHPIASGQYSDVYRATTAEGRRVAVKVIHVSSVNDVRRSPESVTILKIDKYFTQEVKTWCNLDHGNILKFLGTYTIGKQPGLVSLWMNNGTALDFLKDKPNADRLNVLHQCALAVEYLHSKEIAHRDIRGDSILIDDMGNAILSDSGSTRAVRKATDDGLGASFPKNTHSFRFLAPELSFPTARADQVDHIKADVYAFGCTILQLMTGQPPFNEIERAELVPTQASKGYRPRRPPNFDDALWNLCSLCWVHSPIERPPMQNVLFGVRPTPPDLTDTIDLDVHPIACGGYSDVFKGRMAGGTDVAVKVIRITATGVVEKCFKRETLFWNSLDHPHVLKFLGTCMVGYRLGLVSMWMNNGTAFEFLVDKPKTERLKILRQSGLALEYLHSRGISHGDVKGGNILISDTGDALLSDFGLARLKEKISAFSPTPTRIKDAGTIRYMAPELFSEDTDVKQTHFDLAKADVYAFGCTILELMTSQLPWAEIQRDVTVQIRVTTGHRPRRPSDFDDRIWDLCNSCWAGDPTLRPDMTDVANNLTVELDKGMKNVSDQAVVVQKLADDLSRQTLELENRQRALENVVAAATELESNPKDDSVVFTLRNEINSLREQLNRANALNALSRGPSEPKLSTVASGLRQDGAADLRRPYDNRAEEKIKLLEDAYALDEDVLQGLIRGLKIPVPSSTNTLPQKEVLFPANLVSLVINEMWKYGLIAESERFLANVMQTIQSHVMSFSGGDAIIPGIFWLSNVHEILSFICIAESDMHQGIGPGGEPGGRDFDWTEYERLVSIVKHDLDSLEYNIYHTWMTETKKRLAKMVIPALIESQSLPGFITSDGDGGFFSRLFGSNAKPGYNIEDILDLLREVWKCSKSYHIEESVWNQAFTELLKLMGVTSFNDLLMRRNFCSWKRAMQIQHNVMRVEEWCKSHGMPEGTLQLEHLLQATKLLQLKKGTPSDVDIIYDVCWLLTPTQIQRMVSNYYVADYEDPIPSEILKLVASKVTPNDRNDHLLLAPETEEVGSFDIPVPRDLEGLETYIPAPLDLPHIRKIVNLTA